MVHAISEKVSSHVGLFLKHDQLVANYRQILMKTLNILHLVRIKEQFLIKMPTLEIYRGINVSKYVSSRDPCKYQVEHFFLVNTHVYKGDTSKGVINY